MGYLYVGKVRAPSSSIYVIEPETEDVLKLKRSTALTYRVAKIYKKGHKKYDQNRRRAQTTGFTFQPQALVPETPRTTSRGTVEIEGISVVRGAKQHYFIGKRGTVVELTRTFTSEYRVSKIYPKFNSRDRKSTQKEYTDKFREALKALVVFTPRTANRPDSTRG
jgi:hypothetical protein